MLHWCHKSFHTRKTPAGHLLVPVSRDSQVFDRNGRVHKGRSRLRPAGPRCYHGASATTAARGERSGELRRSKESEVATLFTLLALVLLLKQILAVPGRRFQFRVTVLPVPSIEISGSSCGHDCLQLSGTRVSAGQHDSDAVTGHLAEGGEAGGARGFEANADAA